MKKIILAVAAVLALGYIARAETNVSHGITTTTDESLTAQALREATAVRPDWSRYPTINDRDGYAYRNYDATYDGIPTNGAPVLVCVSNTAPDLKGRLGMRVPSNFVAYAYVLNIVQASSVATQRFALGLNATADLLALTTNFGVVQRRSGVIDPAIKATNDNFLILSSDGGTMTGLEFNVMIKGTIEP